MKRKGGGGEENKRGSREDEARERGRVWGV